MRLELPGLVLLFLCATASAASPRLVLTWDVVTEARGYEIEIAEDPEFTRVVVSDSAESARYEWEALPDSPRYWRVRCNWSWGRHGPWSPVRTLIAIHPAEPHLPPDGSHVTWTGVDAAVNVSFHASSVLREHVVELAADPTFTELVAAVETRADTVRLPLLRTGKMHWRVRSTDVLGRPVAPSSSFTFQVTTGVPRSLSPSSGLVMGSAGNALLLRWQPVGPGVEYAVEVETEDGVEAIPVTLPIATWFPARSGTVAWRVRAIGPDGAPGLAASAAFTFQETPAMPVEPVSEVEGVPDAPVEHEEEHVEETEEARPAIPVEAVHEVATTEEIVLPPPDPAVLVALAAPPIAVETTMPPPERERPDAPRRTAGGGGGAAAFFDGGAMTPAAFATAIFRVRGSLHGVARAGYRERHDPLERNGVPAAWNAVARIATAAFEASGSVVDDDSSRAYGGAGVALHVVAIRVGPWTETHVVPALAGHAGIDFRFFGATTFLEVQATSGRIATRLAELDAGGVAFAVGLRFGR